MADLNDLVDKVEDTANDVKHDVQDAAHHIHDEALKEEGRLEQGMDDAKADMEDDKVMGTPGGHTGNIAAPTDRQ